MEELIREIMLEAEKDGEPVSESEAREMAEMELKAKNVKRYERSTVQNQKKKPKTVKISEEKKSIFETILQNLDRNEYISRENITIIKENKLILIDLGDKKFKIDLIQCRK